MAKNKRMHSLEIDLASYSQAFPSVRNIEGKKAFSQPKGFKFKSPKAINDSEYSFEVTNKLPTGLRPGY
ncbi:MAG TPA: hypothetical protein PK747_04935 [Acidobacteriota bacterium]|nr:hypothetical protein [Acidobacteriota bacterium]HQQ46737.1 hypothetical protein [Acidobacteriota bacterium]